MQCSDASPIVEELGVLPEGSVVILDEFNRLSVAEMAHAFRLQQERGLMLSVTYNPGYAGRSQVPPELLERCIVQDMIRPTADPELRVELHRGLLARFGFVQSDARPPARPRDAEPQELWGSWGPNNVYGGDSLW